MVLFALVALGLVLLLITTILAAVGLFHYRARAMAAEQKNAMEQLFSGEFDQYSSARSPTVRPAEVFINIDRDGHYAIDRRTVTIEELESHLQYSTHPRSSVKIRPDMQAPLTAYVEAMNACAKAGVQDVSLVTEGEP